jgi:hypothetical protein
LATFNSSTTHFHLSFRSWFVETAALILKSNPVENNALFSPRGLDTAAVQQQVRKDKPSSDKRVRIHANAEETVVDFLSYYQKNNPNE